MGLFGFGGGVGVVDEPGGFVECVEGFGGVFGGCWGW